MTSIVGGVTFNVDDGPIPYWAKIDWSPEIEHDIYRDWGTYYFNRRRETFAMHYYTKALELNYDDYITLYRRSQVQRKAARIEGALNDALKASKMALHDIGPNCPINLQICDALFELNQFENSSVELHNNIMQFIGVKAQSFEKRLIVIDDVISDVTNRSMSLFFLRNRKLIKYVSQLNKNKDFVDTRPLSKILLEQGKCDVQSIPEIEEFLLSPLEVSRRKRGFNVLHQTYLNDSWYDVVFMKYVRRNPNLLLKQCKRSNAFLETLTNNQYAIIRQFVKMLQARSPLYYVSYLKQPNKKMLEKNQEASLFRIQYQTHRNMISDLRHIRKLRKEKEVKKLAQYVEKVMGDYYVKKTNRVMCWKFEFINEVYNLLALAISEQFYIPKNFRVNSTAMLRLLRLPTDKIKDIVPFKFGDRSTYQEDTDDVEGRRSRRLVSRLERRIVFAKYIIEKTYLRYSIASAYLESGRYDECCFAARRAIKESIQCNSVIYRFLSYMHIIKANTMLHKVEHTKEALEEALPLAIQLNSRTLIKFIEACTTYTDDDYSRKQSSLASQRFSKFSSATLNELESEPEPEPEPL